MNKNPPYKIKVKAPRSEQKYDVTIGLEVHAHLKAASKLFCRCSTDFGAAPNENVCPVCTGMPGSLPVINKDAVAMGVRAALALNLKVNPVSTFARKNYFYPDLPKGYQISQFDQPLASNGYLDIKTGDEERRIGIERAHLEEDAGKLIHTGATGIAGATGALVDLNRASTTLLEIVSDPDMTSPEQAVEYLRTLRQRLIFAGAIDGHMEEGGLRCDANISLKPKGTEPLGVKVEIKNLNSFKFLQKALEHEIARQRRLLAGGNAVIQETRGFDPASEDTFSMRKKEESHDYRYFPEPDLLPLRISEEMISQVQADMPELPDEKKNKYSEWGLSNDQVELLLGDLATDKLFEDCVALSDCDKREFAKWFLNVFLGEINLSDHSLATMKIEPQEIVKTFQLKQAGKVSEKAIPTILQRCIAEGVGAEDVVESENLAVIEDLGFIESAVDTVISANQSQVADYKSGSEKIFNYLIGQTMRELKGKADIKTVREILRKRLG